MISLDFNTSRWQIGIDGIVGALLYLPSKITAIDTVPVTQTALSRGISLRTSSTSHESHFGGQPSLSHGKRVWTTPLPSRSTTNTESFMTRIESTQPDTETECDTSEGVTKLQLRDLRGFGQ